MIMPPTREAEGSTDAPLKAVLVIEEDVPLGSLLLTLLQRNGFAAEWVTDGREGLERLARVLPERSRGDRELASRMEQPPRREESDPITAMFCLREGR
jgi:CheY-like chemotaxis protein